jgi:glycosyltransferase involved in cell wall biosynthesis
LDTRFVFLTPAFNCKDDIQKTLFSMLSQSYQNWRAVFVDDVSNDDTGEEVLRISNQLSLGDKVK